MPLDFRIFDLKVLRFKKIEIKDLLSRAMPLDVEIFDLEILEYPTHGPWMLKIFNLEVSASKLKILTSMGHAPRC